MAEIDIQVRISRPWTHNLDVTISVSHAAGEYLDFAMPVWTPGSYLVREYSRNVHAFTATDAEGNSLGWQKINKNTWRVLSRNVTTVTVAYSVYAFETSVRNSYLDESHAYIAGASAFMFVDNHLDAPHRLTIHAPEGWNRISTGLEPAGGRANGFVAPDFDTLIDSPLEIGNHDVLQFSVRDVPHYISIYGEGNHDPERMKSDVKKIVETAVDLFGGIPYRSYTFMLQLLPEGNSGIEHADSCSLQVSRWAFRKEESYRKFLGLVAHEFFHLWNVKRIRPLTLGPFDYNKENYTRLLWVSEGFTDYYGDLIVRRAAISDPEQYLEGLSTMIQNYLDTPGRLVESAAEASFDAWIKFYRQDAHSPNVTMSYYTKGHLIALVMDLEIRQRTGSRSLDDVMRALLALSRSTARGFTEAEFRNICREIAGDSVDEILDNYAYGTAEMDFDRYLQHAGLRLAEPPAPAKGPPKGYLGVSLRNAEGRIVVAGVPTGSPAFAYGLYLNDEIIAIDGFRVTLEGLAARIEEKAPGTGVDLLVSRMGKIKTVRAVLGEKKAGNSRIVRSESPRPDQISLYESWLNARWQ